MKSNSFLTRGPDLDKIKLKNGGGQVQKKILALPRLPQIPYRVLYLLLSGELLGRGAVGEGLEGPQDLAFSAWRLASV